VWRDRVRFYQSCHDSVNVQLCSSWSIVGRQSVIRQTNCHLYPFRSHSFPGWTYTVIRGLWLHTSTLGAEIIWQDRLILLPELWFWSQKQAWPGVCVRIIAVRHCLRGRDLLRTYYIQGPHFIFLLSVVTSRLYFAARLGDRVSALR
jgi:hypothetical protein